MNVRMSKVGVNGYFYAITPQQRQALLDQGWVDDEATEIITPPGWVVGPAGPSILGVRMPEEFGADPEEADNSEPILEAIAAALDDGVPLYLKDSFTHADTLTWDAVDGAHLRVIAEAGATLTYTGSDYQWDLNMDAGAAGLPSVHFQGGHYVGTTSAAGCFLMHDVRQARFENLEVEDFTNGYAWTAENEGRWTERNEWLGCSSRDNRGAILLDIHTVTATHKAIASGVATITIPGHRFLAGDRVQVALDPPDADYDSSNAQLASVTATTISYATAGANETTTATGGEVYAKGSFARTIVRDLWLQGGTAGVAHIAMHPESGPYDSVFDGVRGNIAEDSYVFDLTPRAMGGSYFDGLGVEVQSAGNVSYFKVPDPGDVSGARPLLAGAPRLTANDYTEDGVSLYDGAAPDDSPFRAHPLYGGVDTEDYVEAGKGLVNRRHTTAARPVIADWEGANPPFGTQVMQDYDTEGRFALWLRTNGGDMRGAALLPSPDVVGTAAPTTGTWSKGQWCRNSSPDPGEPAYWICTSAGTPGTWTAGPTL